MSVCASCVKVPRQLRSRGEKLLRVQEWGKNCSSACWCERTEICGVLPDGSRVKRLCPGWVGSWHIFMALLHQRVLWVFFEKLEPWVGDSLCHLHDSFEGFYVLQRAARSPCSDVQFQSNWPRCSNHTAATVIHKPAVASCCCRSNWGRPGAQATW